MGLGTLQGGDRLFLKKINLGLCINRVTHFSQLCSLCTFVPLAGTPCPPPPPERERGLYSN